MYICFNLVGNFWSLQMLLFQKITNKEIQMDKHQEKEKNRTGKTRRKADFLDQIKLLDPCKKKKFMGFCMIVFFAFLPSLPN